MSTADRAYIIIAAFGADWLLGDPQNPLHPIRIIGKSISAGTSVYRRLKPKSHASQFIGGAALALAVVFASYWVTRLAVSGFYSLNYWAGFGAEAILCYFIIGAGALKKSSMEVYGHLRAGSLEEARKSLSFIVGRDTQRLTEPEIVRAAVETVAENLSDGVIAPLIYIAVGGAPLGMAYKAINTLDSMLGYRNVEFEYFGKTAARLDDLANLIPARLSALLLILACPLTGADAKGAARIFLRDRYNHKSPNSGQTEAACAGALGLCLGGSNYYGGRLVVKPQIGDGVNEPSYEHIEKANRIMYCASALGAVILAVLSAVVSMVFSPGAAVISAGLATFSAVFPFCASEFPADLAAFPAAFSSGAAALTTLSLIGGQ